MKRLLPGMMLSLACLFQPFRQTVTNHQSGRPLNRDEPLEQALAAGELHSYQVTLAEGDFLHVMIRQRGINIAAAFLGPRGERLFEADSPYSAWGAEWLSHVAGAGGLYRIEVRAAEKGAPPGRYQIWIEEQRRSGPQDDRWVAAQRAFLEATRLQAQRGRESNLKAAEKYKEALGWYRAEGRRLEEATTLSSLGGVYVTLADYQQGLDQYEQALILHQGLGDRAGEGAMLHLMGNGNYAWKRFEKAVEYYEQALAIRRGVGDRAGEGSAIYQLGNVDYRLGRFEKAVEYYERALALSREASDRAGEGRALNSLGLAYYDLNLDEKAVECHEQALTIRREVGDQMGEGNTLISLGNAYQRLGNYGKAVKSYERALPISREARNPAGERMTLSNLGNAFYRLGRFEKAVECHEQALAMSREAGDRAGEARALNGLGNDYHSLGHYEKAVESYEQALAIKRKEKDLRGEGSTLGNLGGTYMALGRREEAVEYYKRALALSREVRDRGREASALHNLGYASYTRGRHPEAVAYYEQALAIEREVKDLDGQGDTLSGCMSVWKASNNLGLAVFFGKQAVNTYQEIRGQIQGLDVESQQSFLKTKENAYRTLADLLITLGRLPEAQQVLGMLKEEEYFQFIGRDGKEAASLMRRADLTVQEAAALKRYIEIADQVAAIGHRFQELGRLKDRTPQQEAELARLNADLTAANATFSVVMRKIKEEFRRSSAGRGRETPLVANRGLRSDLQEWGEGAVLLSTIVLENSYRVILTTPAVQLDRMSEVRAAELNKLVDDFRLAVRDPRADPRPLGRRLYKHLIEPVEKDLAQARARTLVWSLDGALRYLPIAALYDGRQYLAERYSNVVITLASQTRLGNRGDFRRRGLGLGVSKPWPGFAPLTSAPEELREIIRDERGEARRGLIPGRVLLDEEFTEKAMMQELGQEYTLVHIASHFFFKPGNAAQSYLLLGDGSRLTLETIKHSAHKQFDKVDLLTLSACDTAIGESRSNGGEVEGFAVLAQEQGAKAVLATLWAVADPSTSELMREYYRHWLSDSRVEKAEALRQAQLALLRGNVELARGGLSARGVKRIPGQPLFEANPSAPYAHPYFWAPFILIGNWK